MVLSSWVWFSFREECFGAAELPSLPRPYSTYLQISRDELGLEMIWLICKDWLD